MPDIDPAALSRPSISSATPILPPKSLSIVPPPPASASAAAAAAPKPSKSTHVPPRIDMEPLYKALKAAVGEHWGNYQEAISLFVMGQSNQAELSASIDWMLASPTGETEHLHNQFMAAIYGNVTREMPDHGVASWVSAHDKPVAAPGSKPVSGDAAELRVKTEVMGLPNRDRRRLKDLALNDLSAPPPYPPLLSTIRLPPPIPLPSGTPTTALHKPNFDLELRKRHLQPLASESGEFPDAATIDARMAPACSEAALPGGHAPDAAQFLAVAAETFVKRFLSAAFGRTRANGPGAGGSAGAGGAAAWVTTARYRRARAREEEMAQGGRLVRDKSGLLPVEARAAGERGALGMADLRRALEVGDCGIGQMGVVLAQVGGGWREGELEGWVESERQGGDVEMVDAEEESEDEDDSDGGWEGAGSVDRDALNGLLDACLANSA